MLVKINIVYVNKNKISYMVIKIKYRICIKYHKSSSQHLSHMVRARAGHRLLDKPRQVDKPRLLDKLRIITRQAKLLEKLNYYTN